MKYQTKIVVPKEEATEMQEILNIKDGAHPNYGDCQVIQTYTGTFENGFQCDIKVCNANTPYIDPVLFDESGCEVSTMEVEETLLGEFIWYVDDDEFTAIVELAA